ncbi:MAG: hypothetical protein MMC23_007404 [Stictis urceolatum]|nr:hypothetical protein [Stictis urceolata]
MATSLKRVPIPKNGVDYRGKVVLAPMVRSGECPSRLLALKYGADLVWGPETVDKSMIGTTRRINSALGTVDFTRLSSNHQNKVSPPPKKESLIYRLHSEKEKGKLIFQIGTANPETAVNAAKLVAGDVAGIDVNAGCPKPFSTSGGMGAALLKTPDLLVSILQALVKEVGQVYEIGISVKIRILSTPEETEALVRKLVATGITGLTVHCRTTPMRPRERAIRNQLRMIGDICREAGVACLMNGDVTSREEAVKLAEEYGVDGGMIATAAERNSSVFREEGTLPWKEVAREYFRLAVGVENRWGNTKFLLAQLMPGKAEEAKKCQQAKNYTTVCEILDMDDLHGRCRELDNELGLFEKTLTPKQKTKHNPSAIAAGSRPAKNKSEDEHRNKLSQRGVGSAPALAV